MDCSPPGFSVLGFSRKDYWNGLPCPPLGELLDPGINPKSLMSPALAGRFFLPLVPPCCSVIQWCPTLCDPMDCSTPGFPVLHHLPELAQTHVHWVSDAIQPSHPLSSPSPPAFNPPASVSFPMSQFFVFGGQSIGASASTSVLPMNIQHWSLLRLTCLVSLQSKRLSRVFSNTTVQKHHYFGTQPSLWSSSCIHAWLLEKP